MQIMGSACCGLLESLTSSAADRHGGVDQGKRDGAAALQFGERPAPLPASTTV
jgi:hypothetical protein